MCGKVVIYEAPDMPWVAFLCVCCLVLKHFCHHTKLNYKWLGVRGAQVRTNRLKESELILFTVLLLLLLFWFQFQTTETYSIHYWQWQHNSDLFLYTNQFNFKSWLYNLHKPVLSLSICMCIIVIFMKQTCLGCAKLHLVHW